MMYILIFIGFVFCLYFFRRRIKQPFLYIRHILFLHRANKNTNLIKVDNNTFIERAFKIARKWNKNSLTRRMLFGLIQKLRKETPYRIQNFSKAESLYKEYFTLERHVDYKELLEWVNSGKTAYLLKFREENPVKGKRHSEYYINGSEGFDFVVKTTKFDEKYNWIGTEYVSTGEYAGKIDERDITMYLYATESQIKLAEEKFKQRKEIELKIEKKQKELSKLYTEKSNIK